MVSLLFDSFEEWRSGLYRLFLNYLSNVSFSWLDWVYGFLLLLLFWGVCFFRKKTTVGKCHFHHIISREHTLKMTQYFWCQSWPSGWGSLFKIFVFWSYSFSHFQTVLFGQTQYVQPTVKGWGGLFYLESRIAIEITWNSSAQAYPFSPIYLHIQSFIYIHIN